MDFWLIIFLWASGGFIAGWLGCLVTQAMFRAGRT
jgi:hypothetical protein